MINESNYIVKSTSGYNTYTVTATKSEWTCSCPDYARHNAKCSMYMQLNIIDVKARHFNPVKYSKE
ncbi:MAG TPA: hypothetical protein VH796_14455 [Nitrososphaeraceae archaeon]